MHDADKAADRTLHLAVDCDDVLVDFWPRVLRCFNKEFGESLEMDAQNDWGDNPIKKSEHFGPGKAYASWWEWWRDRHWLWATCDAIPGAIGGLKALAERGHYVELLTHKPDWARREMTAWLAKWHPRFDRLTLVALEESKSTATDAKILIDDKPKNVREWIESDKKRHAILFTRPWNVQWDWGVDNARLTRAETWADILTALDFLKSPFVRIIREAGPLRLTSDYRTPEYHRRLEASWRAGLAQSDDGERLNVQVPTHAKRRLAGLMERGMIYHHTVTPPRKREPDAESYFGKPDPEPDAEDDVDHVHDQRCLEGEPEETSEARDAERMGLGDNGHEPETDNVVLRCVNCGRPGDGPSIFAYNRLCPAGDSEPGKRSYCTLFTHGGETHEPAEPDEGFSPSYPADDVCAKRGCVTTRRPDGRFCDDHAPHTKPVVVGVCGYKRAGKDTVGRMLVNRYDFTRRAFADPLKEAALAALEGFNPKAAATVREHGWESLKEWDPRYRRYLQAFGTEAIRSLDPDFWPRVTLDKVEPGERVVVTDVRFPNEVEAVKRHGGLVVRVDRPGCGGGSHASEQVELLDVDAVLDNSGTLPALARQVDEFAAKHGLAS